MQNWHVLSVYGINRATSKTRKYLGEEQRERHAERRVQPIEKHGEQGHVSFEVKKLLSTSANPIFPTHIL